MISLIACIDLNNGIGYNNDLLINLPNDMKHFKELTNGHFVVMGRKTYDSIGHPLPNRKNIIITRNKNYEAPKGTFVYHSIEEVIHEYKNLNNNESELFFIGGSEIYSEVIHYADRIYLTIIDNSFEKADSYFPRINLTYWKPIQNVKNEANETHPYDYYFVTYEKRFKNN